MAEPSIAVVIPARDAQATLPATLASLACQDRLPDEVVVVDDGSRDATGDVARAAGATVVVDTGRGAGAARNAGIRATSAEVVAFLDADDRWSPDHLAEVGRALADPAVDIAAAWVEDRTAEGVIVQRRRPPGTTPTPLEVLERGPLLTSATAVRRARLLSAGGFTERFPRATVEDAHLWARMLHDGAQVAAIASCTTYVVRAPEDEAAVRRWAQDHAWLVRDGVTSGWLDDEDGPAAWRAHHRLVAVRALASGHRGLAARAATRALPDPTAAAVLGGCLLPAAARDALRDRRRARRGRVGQKGQVR